MTHPVANQSRPSDEEGGGGGGHPDPEIRGKGGGLKKNLIKE